MLKGFTAIGKTKTKFTRNTGSGKGDREEQTLVEGKISVIGRGGNPGTAGGAGEPMDRFELDLDQTKPLFKMQGWEEFPGTWGEKLTGGDPESGRKYPLGSTNAAGES